MINPKPSPLSLRRRTGRLFALMVLAAALFLSGAVPSPGLSQRSRPTGPAAADGAGRSAPIIIDHTCIDPSRIPV